MKLRISRNAEKELRKLHRLDQIVLVKKIRSLPVAHGVTEKLSGFKNMYRIRVGQYRIVYRQKKHEIFIVLIGHRKNIYKLLKHMFE